MGKGLETDCGKNYIACDMYLMPLDHTVINNTYCNIYIIIYICIKLPLDIYLEVFEMVTCFPCVFYHNKKKLLPEL